jgi:hypothetical protein
MLPLSLLASIQARRLNQTRADLGIAFDSVRDAEVVGAANDGDARGLFRRLAIGRSEAALSAGPITNRSCRPSPTITRSTIRILNG